MSMTTYSPLHQKQTQVLLLDQTQLAAVQGIAAVEGVADADNTSAHADMHRPLMTLYAG